MLVSTKAFILSYLKYGDNSLIIKVFSEKFGFKSLILKSVYNTKSHKVAIIFPLNEVEISFQNKPKIQLNYIQTIQNSNSRYNLSQQITKSTILLFLSEILNQCLQNEQTNDELYLFISNQLDELNESKQYPFFHLKFILNFSYYLGFYPSIENYTEGSFFHLKEGLFSFEKEYDCLNESESKLWYEFISNTENFKPLKTEKYQLLETIFRYYSNHINHFNKPKSLEILKEVFD